MAIAVACPPSVTQPLPIQFARRRLRRSQRRCNKCSRQPQRRVYQQGGVRGGGEGYGRRASAVLAGPGGPIYFRINPPSVDQDGIACSIGRRRGKRAKGSLAGTSCRPSLSANVVVR
uniref:Uncharacterized protein n=1 Tax=Plectus sambesii TaxID=2011161 RepID=A0A914VDL7_9BILA